MPLTYKGIILSLCEISGTWSRPYVALGYKVIRVDPKHGEWKSLYQDRGMTDRLVGNGTLVPMADGGFGLSYSVQALANVLLAKPDYFGLPVVGVIMAPPCTDYTVSCNRLWKQKDADGRTAVSNSIVQHCLIIRDFVKPKWWVLENPVGRIATCVPEVGARRMIWNPWQYAGWADVPSSEAYPKKTCLYGDFNVDLEQRPVPPPDGVSGNNTWITKLGGKSERTKELRSATPQGFSRAFAAANP